MSKFVTIEVCVNGTITRACARAINRAWREAGYALIPSDLCSGSSLAADVAQECVWAGVEYRVVQAASLTGADKGRHTREVNISRNAQARRTERKTTEERPLDDFLSALGFAV